MLLCVTVFTLNPCVGRTVSVGVNDRLWRSDVLPELSSPRIRIRNGFAGLRSDRRNANIFNKNAFEVFFWRGKVSTDFIQSNSILYVQRIA